MLQYDLDGIRLWVTNPGAPSSFLKFEQFCSSFRLLGEQNVLSIVVSITRLSIHKRRDFRVRDSPACPLAPFGLISNPYILLVSFVNNWKTFLYAYNSLGNSGHGEYTVATGYPIPYNSIESRTAKVDVRKGRRAVDGSACHW